MPGRPLWSPARGLTFHSVSARHLRDIVAALDRLWRAISEALFVDTGKPDATIQESARNTALVVWLLGKTGAGKTAIVAALTGDPRAEVGQGFEPCTRTAAFYDVPPEAPLLRFLDTRGLGEADYDPASDIVLVRGAVAPSAGRDAGCRPGSGRGAAGAAAGAPPPSRVAGGRGADRPAPPLSRRNGASDVRIPTRAARTTRRRRNCRTRCARRSPISAGCSTACADRSRASCRSTSPFRRTGFRRTITGSTGCGASCRRSGPRRSKRCTPRAPDRESDRPAGESPSV